jgi:SAM-dependent methyltransferase
VTCPVLDGIPFLRAGRDALAAEALARQGAGDDEGALVLLLADQDDWWRGPRAEEAALRDLVRNRHRLSLREAMARLSWGPVADYFAHRWSDPTFLAGLALVEAHWNAPRRTFELACGIGHHLRELSRRGVAVAGADVVFAKLWITRHWVCPEAELWCLDAAQPWPELGRYDLVACHDAFYFLEPKREILARLRGLLAPGGLLAIGHVHNRDWPNLSAGSAVSRAEMEALFPDAARYDDAELTRALAEPAPPTPASRPMPRRSAWPRVAAMPPPACSPCRRRAAPCAATPSTTPPPALPGQRALRRRIRPARHLPRSPPTLPPRPPFPPATREQARRRELLDLPERW